MILKNAKLGFEVHASSISQAAKNINGTNTSAMSTSSVAFINSFCGNAMIGISANYNNLSPGNGLLDVGFEDTPVSESDYILADGNATSARLTVVARGKNTATLGEICNVYTNFRNDGNTSVIVKEIGLYGNPTGSSSSGGNNTALLCRKVLDAPVTIAPGETYSFNYVMRFKS